MRIRVKSMRRYNIPYSIKCLPEYSALEAFSFTVTSALVSLSALSSSPTSVPDREHNNYLH